MRRRLFKLMVFLLLGAIVNVAVAWGCAVAGIDAVQQEVAITFGPVASVDSRWERVIQTRSLGCVVHEYRFPFRGADMRLEGDTISQVAPRFCGNDPSPPRRHSLPARVVSWSAIGIASDRSRFIESELAAGWPMQGLWGCVNGADFRDGKKFEMHAMCIAFGPSQATTYELHRPSYSIPLKPIWPGFAINTICYAGILWLLFAAPGMIRRKRRIKRGLCPACAYPVGLANACSECGAAVTPKAVAS